VKSSILLLGAVVNGGYHGSRVRTVPEVSQYA